MSQYDISEYTFLGLCNHGKPLGPRPGAYLTSLAYLIGLTDSPTHKIADPLPANRILAYLFDTEEQARNAADLLSAQESFCSRYFPGGYYPQTPVMLTREWSPIAALLERGLTPLALRREERLKSVATGIWEPAAVTGTKSIKDCTTPEELFWAAFSEVSRRAEERGMLLSIIGKPGWDYETDIGLLPKWSDEEAAKADRILWKRTPEAS